MPAFDEKLDARFAELLDVPRIEIDSFGRARGDSLMEGTKWLLAAGNFVGAATGQRGVYWDQVQDILGPLGKGFGPVQVRRMEGILRATNDDRMRGLLGDLQYAIYAETFDDFLDIAADLHKRGQMNAAAVLASAVLEDTFKKIAERNDVDPNPSLDPLINELAKKAVLSRVEAKHARAYADVRTSAFHARWDELDLTSVGKAIAGTRGFIASHLA